MQLIPNLLFWLAAPLTVTSLPALQVAPPVTALQAPEVALEQRIDALVAEFLSQPGAVGLSVGIARGGQVLLSKGYGIADAEFNVRADGETLFRIGSVTKQFTAAAILKLVEQGKLSLDDTLETLVPEFPTPGHTVTLRQLLNHTSGILSYTDVGEEWQAKWPLELSDAELLALVADKPFNFEPGQDWDYNNTGYYLLGMILAKSSSTTYGEHLKQTLFDPLKLARTRYDSNRDLIKNRAQGYSFEDGQLINDFHLGMSQPGGAGGLLSTGGELVRWQMALTSGKVVSPESYGQMTSTTVLPNGRDTGYGFGLAVDEFEGQRRISHGGGIHGFNSQLLWLPESDVHIAVISNGEALASDRVANALSYAVLGITKAPVHDKPTTSELREQLAGDYRIKALDLDLRIFSQAERLFCQASGQGAFGLKWQGGQEFRADFDEDVRLVFDPDGQGFSLHQSGGVMRAERLP